MEKRQKDYRSGFAILTPLEKGNAISPRAYFTAEGWREAIPPVLSSDIQGLDSPIVEWPTVHQGCVAIVKSDDIFIDGLESNVPRHSLAYLWIDAGAEQVPTWFEQAGNFSQTERRVGSIHMAEESIGHDNVLLSKFLNQIGRSDIRQLPLNRRAQLRLDNKFLFDLIENLVELLLRQAKNFGRAFCIVPFDGPVERALIDIDGGDLQLDVRPPTPNGPSQAVCFGTRGATEDGCFQPVVRRFRFSNSGDQIEFWSIAQKTGGGILFSLRPQLHDVVYQATVPQHPWVPLVGRWHSCPQFLMDHDEWATDPPTCPVLESGINTRPSGSATIHRRTHRVSSGGFSPL